mgnify:CR=1 FL=1
MSVSQSGEKVMLNVRNLDKLLVERSWCYHDIGAGYLERCSSVGAIGQRIRQW